MTTSMPSPEHVEVEVGHQGCDLDERVGLQVESGHLAVDPDESFIHEGTLLRGTHGLSGVVQSLRLGFGV